MHSPVTNSRWDIGSRAVCFRLLKLLDFRARFCYDRIRWVLRRRRPIYTTYDTVKRRRFTIGGENVVFIVILSSILLAVCTSLKPIYLQNAIDAVEAGTGDARAMFICYLVSILGILLFETARQLSTGKYRTASCSVSRSRSWRISSICRPGNFRRSRGRTMSPR